MPPKNCAESSSCFIYNLFINLFFNKRVWGGVWGLVEKVGLNTAVLQLVLPGLFLEIWEGWTALSYKFSNGKDYDGCKARNSHSVQILGFVLMSAFLRPVLGGLGQFLYILLIYALFGIKEIASHTSMQMVGSNEKNNIIYSSSMSEQMRNV